MSKKSKSTSGPSAFAQPFIQEGADALTSAYNQTAPKISEQTDMVLGGLNPFLMDRLENGDEGVNAAKSYGADVLAGNYLDSNPYFDQVVSDSINDTVNAGQAALGLKGLTGGSNYADIISRNAGRVSNEMRSDNYTRERASMDAAAGRAGSLAAADYLPVGGLLSSINASMAPMQAAGMYAGGLGGLLGGYQTQSGGGGGGGILGQLLGAGATLGSAALMGSERRIKKNITHVDTMPDGLGVYTFNYKTDEEGAPLYTGVMVDEVEVLRPWALGPVVDGVQTVDYSKLEQGQ